MTCKNISPSDLNDIIGLAWADDVSFDEIEKRLGVTEGEVIRIMRGHLKLGSFKVWRARVSGRKAKHAKLARAYRAERHIPFG
jgi:uncharacterized protein (TIGR03643 family)